MKVSIRDIERRIESLEASKRAGNRVRSVVDAIDIRKHIADCYIPVHDAIEHDRCTFFNLSGGRGSGKSSFAAIELIYQIMNDPTGLSNALVIRKYGNTLRGSVFNTLQWAINILGVADLWTSTVTPMEFRFITGQAIRLSGLDDPEKLKSLRPAKGYYRFLWIEEFSEISGELELRNLQQSVLRGGDRFTAIRTYNPPISPINWVNQLAERSDDDTLTLRTDYRQMPAEWLGKLFFAEAERLRGINPRAYQHEYEGLPIGNGTEVFPNAIFRRITDEEIRQQVAIFEGIDFGFASDPTAFLRVSYDSRTDTIYLLDEIYRHGLSNSVLADMIIEKGYHMVGVLGRQKQRIVGDSADPRSISDLKGYGLKVAGCHKEPGCVQYRTRWLQHRRIVVDADRTPEAAREIRNYSYITDRRSGEVTSDLPDKDNHAVDALAYSLDRLIYRKGISA